MSTTTAEGVGGIKTRLMCCQLISAVNNMTKHEVASETRPSTFDLKEEDERRAGGA